MSDNTTFYSRYEEYVLSRNKEEVINRCFSGDEKIFYEILYLQVYCPGSCDKQKALLEKVDRFDLSSSMKELYETLKARMILLEQEDNRDILPEVKDFIMSKNKISLEVTKPTNRVNTKTDEEHKYETALDYNKLDAFIDQRYKDKECTKMYYTQKLETNKDPKMALFLLKQVSRKGVPGVVDNIMLYLSTLEDPKEGRFFTDILTYEDMAILATRVKKQFKFNLYEMNSFRRDYMNRFGKTRLDDDADTTNVNRILATYKRRIDFLTEYCPSCLCSEYQAYLMFKSEHGMYDQEGLLKYLELKGKEERVSFSKSYGFSISEWERTILTHLFPNTQPTKFLRYYDDDDLLYIYDKCVLLTGKDIKSNHMDKSDIASLRDEIRLNILKDNKTEYHIGETVQVQVELKNINSIEVRMFEVNTRVYYEQNNNDIPITLDLDGLQPIKSSKYTYSLPSIVSHIETFEFPFVNHRGVFIIDFISNSKSSRFLVHMGCLHVLRRTCLSGYALTIIDDLGKRVEEGVHAILDNREYELNDQKEIIIPFLPPSESNKNGNVLICQDIESGWQYAIRYPLMLNKEEFTLNLNGDVDNEALIPGNENCELILHLSALLNGVIYPLSLLRNIAITISVVSAQNITSKTTLTPSITDNIKDFSYSFRVTDIISSVSATVTADAALNNGSMCTLKASTTLFSDSSKYNKRMVTSIDKEMHLFRRISEQKQLEYVLQVNGPSGEPLIAEPINFKFSHKYLSSSYQVTLQTDEKGLITLGSLINIDNFVADGVQYIPFHNTYDIRSNWTVSSCDAIQAIIPKINPDIKAYQLVCRSIDDNYKSCENKITFDGDYCIVSELPAGIYLLYVKDTWNTEYTIQITVHATFMPAECYDSFIVWGKYARSLITMPLAMNCTIDNKQLNIKLNGGDENRHVNVLCKTYIDSHIMGDEIAKSKLDEDMEWYDLYQPLCMTANNRALWEEYSYILERKKHDTTIPGNMLPYPGLLLNPIEFASTETKTKEAKKGNEYSKDKNYSRTGNEVADIATTISHKSIRRVPVNKLTAPSMLFVNVTLDENGCGTVPLPSLPYGYEVLIVGTDSRHTVQSSYYIEEQASDKNSTTLLNSVVLSKSFEPDKHYVEEKCISIVSKESPLVLESKNEMEILNSRKDIWLLLDTLSSTSLSDFTFLLNWESLALNEKLKYYNRYNCSEINVFLYFKDPDFFNTYVKVYLQSKIEKSFLDYYLTDADVSIFTQPALLAKLNSFEKALLCSRVNGEQGEMICKGMENSAKYTVLSSKNFSHIFNTVLKLKTMKKEDQAQAQAEEEEMDVEEDQAQAQAQAQAEECVADCLPVQRPMMYGCGRMASSNIRRMVRPIVCCAAPPEPMCCAAPPEPAMYCAEAPEPVMCCRNALPRVRCGRCMKSCANSSRADIANYQEKRFKNLYESMENTKEYREGYYYQSKQMYSSPSIVPISPFWSDFARYLRSDRKSPFTSSNFYYCTHSLSEILFCIAVLDISASEPVFSICQQGQVYNITTESPLYVFHKIIKETNTIESDTSIIIIQKYINNKNPTEVINGEKVDRYMNSNEFLPHEPYSCKIIMSNTSSREKNVSLLYQIPQGSYPLSNQFTMHTESILLKPFSTQTFVYSFYFPQKGSFIHYPAHLNDALTSKVIAYAVNPFTTLEIVDHIKTIDSTSWADVAATASLDEIIQFLHEHNLNDINWKYITYRLTNKEFFLAFVQELRSIGYYTEIVWKFGLMHNDFISVKEYLQQSFTKHVGFVFNSPLLTVNPAVEDSFQIREYKPYINNRTYRLGKSLDINNDKLKTQYEKLLKVLSQKQPTTDDYALIVYYLLLQDRIELAKEIFVQYVCDKVNGRLIKKADCTCTIQFDYMLAYFDCFSSELIEARAICKKYENYGILYWRQMFANITTLVNEMDGVITFDIDSEAEDQTNLPKNIIQKKRNSFGNDTFLTIDNKDTIVTITYNNITSVHVNLYELNIELMFSANPFMKDKAQSDIYIRSNYSEMITLPEVPKESIYGSYEYHIPDELKNKNLLIEIKSETHRETAYSFNNQMVVLLSQKEGQLRVFDKTSRKPLSCCYVKVYAKIGSTHKFLKDGHTDIRGFFDYYSVSSDVMHKAEHLAIFVDKEGYGSCIRDVAPPTSAK